MEQNLLHNISLSKFRSFFADAASVGMGDDFYIIDVSIRDGQRILAYPCRIDGFMVIYCMNGHIRLNVNLQEYDLKSGMLFLNYPGNIIRVNEIMGSEPEDLRCVCVVMSREFVDGLMVDVNKIFTQDLSLMETPAISISEAEKSMLREHISLMDSVVRSKSPFKTESVRSILSSVFYFLAGVWAEKARECGTDGMSIRIRAIFEQFIKLVTEYHTVHRTMPASCLLLRNTCRKSSRRPPDVPLPNGLTAMSSSRQRIFSNTPAWP